MALQQLVELARSVEGVHQADVEVHGEGHDAVGVEAAGPANRPPSTATTSSGRFEAPSAGWDGTGKVTGRRGALQGGIAGPSPCGRRRRATATCGAAATSAYEIPAPRTERAADEHFDVQASAPSSAYATASCAAEPTEELRDDDGAGGGSSSQGSGADIHPSWPAESLRPHSAGGSPHSSAEAGWKTASREPSLELRSLGGPYRAGQHRHVLPGEGRVCTRGPATAASDGTAYHYRDCPAGPSPCGRRRPGIDSERNGSSGKRGTTILLHA